MASFIASLQTCIINAKVELQKYIYNHSKVLSHNTILQVCKEVVGHEGYLIADIIGVC